MLRIARVLHSTTAEGPGLRTAVWVQGCSIRCTGCINPQLFSSRGGTQVEVKDLVRSIVEAGDEGLTVLGGEPFDQAEGLAELAEAARAAHLGVMVFSGYTREHLEENAAARRALAATDLLVDGPYRRDEPETERRLVGSSNQVFHNLTDRYTNFDPAEGANRVDVRLLADGSLEVAGFMDAEKAALFRELLGLRRGVRSSPTYGVDPLKSDEKRAAMEIGAGQSVQVSLGAAGS